VCEEKKEKKYKVKEEKKKKNEKNFIKERCKWFTSAFHPPRRQKGVKLWRKKAIEKWLTRKRFRDSFSVSSWDGRRKFRSLFWDVFSD
jgi:hypothetical protein